MFHCWKLISKYMCLLLRLYKPFQGEEASVDDLIELVQQIVAFHMKV